MSWIILFTAGLFEVAWALGLRFSDGLSSTRLWSSALTLISLTISFVLLAKAVRVLPIGTAYAVWTGIGAAGTALGGMYWFGEPATAGRLFFIAMIIAGVGGLKFLE